MDETTPPPPAPEPAALLATLTPDQRERLELALHRAGETLRAIWESVRPVLQAVFDALAQAAQRLSSQVEAVRRTTSGRTGLAAQRSPYGPEGDWATAW